MFSPAYLPFSLSQAGSAITTGVPDFICGVIFFRNPIAISLHFAFSVLNFISTGDIEGSKKNTLLLRENNKEVELRISISKSEYKYLVDLSNKHGFNSATKEAKFLLLNLLNSDSPIFNNVEMEELRKSNYELNMVGRNINQMLKVLYEQDLQNFKVNYENLISVVKVVNDKISAVSDKIEKYIKILNLKLK